LRILQELRFERLGGDETIHTDVRLLAATNKDLRQEIEAGRFRADLFYRLNVFIIHLPPLRERREDIPLLIERFLQEPGTGAARVRSVAPDALERLMNYDWPGNVRQLQSMLKYAVIQAAGDILTLDCLPASLRPELPVGEQPAGSTALEHLTKSYLRAGETDIYRRVSLEMDRIVLETVLRHVKGNQVQASELLGISRTTLRSKLRLLGMVSERFSAQDDESAHE
jgi:two-component system nitrogen regulation response regulator GlnG